MRPSDIDVLMILYGLVGRSKRMDIILGNGSGNNRRYNDMTNIVAALDERNHGFTDALLFCECSGRIGCHILGHRKGHSEAST